MKPRKHAELIKRWADDSEAVVQWSFVDKHQWENVFGYPNWQDDLDYRISLAIVEGKPVFDDSIIFRKDNGLRVRWDATAKEFQDSKGCWKDEDDFELSWNQPKPATVTVELLRKDAKHFTEQDFMPEGFSRIVAAMKDALK